MQLKKLTALQFLNCPTCDASSVQSKLCPACKGLKRVIKQDGFYLSWDYNLKKIDIIGRRVQSYFTTVINAILFAIILFLIGLTLWKTYLLVQNVVVGIPIYAYFKIFREPIIYLLWAAVFGMFLFFRVNKNQIKMQIPKHKKN